MDDSDDDNYFLDSDLLLDEKTLAILDEEESKYKRISNTQPRQSVGPPAKRQKTSGSWQPHPTSKTLHRTDTLDDIEDLPDISIRQDGTYDIHDKQRGPTGPPTSSSRPGLAPSTGPSVVARAAPGARSTTVASLPRGPAPPVRGAGLARVVPARPLSATHVTRIARSPASSQEVSRTQSSPSQRRVNKAPSTTVPGNYVDQLRQQIEELQKENKAIHTEMASALEAKFSKEGEVTILRKRLEKTAQDHIAQLAKLKAAKDEADAKHVLLQKQYEADKERLRTELTFKRHELETSSRKHTVALSPKTDVSQSKESRPFQRQRSSQWGSVGPPQPEPETPHRPRFGVVSDFERQKKPTVPEARVLPSGFQTGPPRSQFVEGRKRKETTASIPPTSPVVPSATPLESNDQFAQPDVFGTQMDDISPVEEFIPPVDGGNDDVHMVDAGTPAVTFFSQESTTVLILSNWSLVLHDIMLTHRRQGSELPTLQLLVSAPPADAGQVQSYGAVLMRIFDTLGSIPAYPDRDFDDLSQVICCALCEITELLAKNDLIFPLTAVLNLLTNLTYMLPPIHTLLLSRHVPGQDETPQLLAVLHNIIRERLQTLEVSTRNEPPELYSLGKETLALYEALVWSMPDDLEDCLSACPKMSSLITTLLCPHRPPWFLIGSMRILLWLSTRRNLSRSLLSHPTSEQTAHDSEPVEPAHHSQIAHICSLLVDTDRQGPEADELKSHIIMFFGMLSSSHSDMYTLLVESQELIPSIVLYLCHLVAPIWDEDGVILSDPLAATRTIRIINHATLLLHHLVVGEETTLDLRERLLCASPKAYQGLIHCFILTFGRLSYANPPYWLDEQDRERLLGVADLARALLERVIQGPELDLIWETYQEEGEENDTAMDVDDEEVEAQKIADS